MSLNTHNNIIEAAYFLLDLELHFMYIRANCVYKLLHYWRIGFVFESANADNSYTCLLNVYNKNTWGSPNLNNTLDYTNSSHQTILLMSTYFLFFGIQTFVHHRITDNKYHFYRELYFNYNNFFKILIRFET